MSEAVGLLPFTGDGTHTPSCLWCQRQPVVRGAATENAGAWEGFEGNALLPPKAARRSKHHIFALPLDVQIITVSQRQKIKGETMGERNSPLLPGKWGSKVTVTNGPQTVPTQP